jgi:hypothetical protein
MVLSVEAWKAKVVQLTQELNKAKTDFSEILNEWEDVRADADNAGKEPLDKCFSDLHTAKSELCALRGGRVIKRKQRRTRKHRR